VPLRIAHSASPNLAAGFGPYHRHIVANSPVAAIGVATVMISFGARFFSSATVAHPPLP